MLVGAGCTGDPLLAAVSRSSPGPRAAGALDSCGITNFVPGQPGTALNLGTDVAAAMALVHTRSDANNYAALGNSPDIATSKPAWVITTTGWLALGVFAAFAARPAENPTWVMIDGDWDNPQMVSTGSQMIDERFVTPFPRPSSPSKLPTPVLGTGLVMPAALFAWGDR